MPGSSVATWSKEVASKMIFYLVISVLVISQCLYKVLQIFAQQKRNWKDNYEKLSYFFGLSRGYKIYVSVKGLDKWQQVFGKGEIEKLRIKNYCVCYASGEILEVYAIVKNLPEGAHWIEENEDLGFEKLDEDEVELNSKEIIIENSLNKKPCNVTYETKITNMTGGKIYPIAFGGYVKNGFKFELSNVVESAYSASQFRNWYGLQKDYIQNGESVSDPNNYGDGDSYWIYVFETESGQIKKTGCFLGNLRKL